MIPGHRVDLFRSVMVLVCSIAILPGDTLAYGFAQSTSANTPAPQAPKIPPEQLDSLVAPIALYPDPLLAQALAASTYPLEIIQLQQWLAKHKGLKDKALADAVAKEPWDPSVQALAALPEVANRLANDIQWTTDLGNAFLSQQSDMMEAVQRMRTKALEKGTLKTTEQQKVETQVIEKKNVVVIQPANPEVIYVPSYDPVYVWGPAYYPYPPIYYPTGYYAAGLAISFGVGLMWGAFWGGAWGWGCGWGGNNVYINHNNNFNRNIGGGNRPSQLPSRGGAGGVGGVGGVGGIGGAGGVGGVGGVGGIGGAGGVGGVGGVGGIGGVGGVGGAGGVGGVGGNRPSQLPANAGRSDWSHNPEHRGGAPYRDRATADRFGGTARGDSLARRQASARQQLGRTQRASQRSSFGGQGNRSGGSGLGNRGSDGSLGGGPDRIGSRDLSRSGGGNRDAFGGGSRGYSGSRDRGSSSRGMSSMSRGGGGGFSRSGGGGFRGGGGRRR